MKLNSILLSTFLISGCFFTDLHAQDPVKTNPVPVKAVPKTYSQSYRAVDTVKNSDFSLNGQYQFMLSKSRNINGYKLINPTRLSAVWQSAMDTLRKERVALKQVNSLLKEQQDTVSRLKSEVSGKETILNDSNAKINEISFLGIPFTKGSYHLTVWSIIAILAIALIIVISRSAKNILEARHRTQLFDEISTEFQNYKSKANEKERKLARALQDERNVVEELKSRGK